MDGRLGWLISSGLVLATLLGAAARPATADGIAEKVEACASCHGEDGKPADKMTPVIW
jgi:cytochrome c553